MNNPTEVASRLKLGISYWFASLLKKCEIFQRGAQESFDVQALVCGHWLGLFDFLIEIGTIFASKWRYEFISIATLCIEMLQRGRRQSRIQKGPAMLTLSAIFGPNLHVELLKF